MDTQAEAAPGPERPVLGPELIAQQVTEREARSVPGVRLLRLDPAVHDALVAAAMISVLVSPRSPRHC